MEIAKGPCTNEGTSNNSKDDFVLEVKLVYLSTILWRVKRETSMATTLG